MRRKLVLSLCIILYLVAGLFWCNPWVVNAITGNEIPVEIPEIFADDSSGQQDNFSWNGHALIRLEDVHPLRDIATLTDCIEVLKSKDIPFSIALIPIYKNPQENITICLHERPELVRIIKDSGATIVLNGSAYQYNGETAVVPIDLGYVRGEEPVISVFQVLQRAKEISENNDSDAIVSFSYNPSFGPSYLRTIIGGLSKQGYRFASPEEYIMSVNMESVEIIPQCSKVIE